jgi:hypothetical protein
MCGAAVIPSVKLLCRNLLARGKENHFRSYAIHLDFMCHPLKHDDVIVLATIVLSKSDLERSDY